MPQTTQTKLARLWLQESVLSKSFVVSSAPRVQPGSAQEVGLGAVWSWLAGPHSVIPTPCSLNSGELCVEEAFFPSAACVSSGASTGGALPGASVLFPIPRPSAVVLAGGRKSSDVKRGSGLVADGSLLGCLFAAMQWACSCASRTRWSPSHGPEGESGARLSRSSGSSLDVYAQFACPGKAVPGLLCLG